MACFSKICTSQAMRAHEGIIPAAFDDQLAAQRLAMCNDIGEAAYVDSLVAASLVEHLSSLPARHRSPADILAQRCGLLAGLPVCLYSLCLLPCPV